MSSEIILRIQSANQGMKRIKTTLSESAESFLDRIAEEFKTDVARLQLWQDRNKSRKILPEDGILSGFDLKHGDILFLDVYQDKEASPNVSGPQSLARAFQNIVLEDEIDQILGKMDGKIHRERNEQLCRHGSQGKCIHCIPLEPYDEEYLSKANPPLKFLSFHSYLRKMNNSVGKGKFDVVEDVNCSVKTDCKEHLPWPEGTCSKCQPKSMTLQAQRYRHVDFIQFENAGIADGFLNFWRKSGSQRVGLLYGRYEHHKDVPLGIKAVVSAIYEPKQISDKNSFELVDDEKNAQVDGIAMKLGLQRIGWVFTDLVPLDRSKGTVKHYRGNADTHFLSAEECLLAAEFQNQYPNPCRLAVDGRFGSKFVTVVVTGDSTNQIHFEGYQVSNQCMALVKNDFMLPTIDAPELAYIRESTKDQRVPDVMYSKKNDYGLEVIQPARPFPVEFLLQDIAVAFPKEQLFTFRGDGDHVPFPVENRKDVGEEQTFDSFCRYMKQFQRVDYMQAFRNFHLLVFLSLCDDLPFRNAVDGLLDAVRTGDEGKLREWLETETWTMVEEIMKEHSSQGKAVQWDCKHCTYLNSTTDDSCELCGLPKN